MNKKGFIFLLSVFIFGLVLVMVLSTPAAFSSPALVINGEDSCGIPDVNWQGWPINGPPRGDGRIVFTNNANGIVNGMCTGKLPDGAALPDKAYTRWGKDFPEMLCGLPADPEHKEAAFTNDWRITITPSGQAQLICKIH